MVVTIKDVRDCLNNISTDEVADDTVQDKIGDAEAWVEEGGGDPEDDDWGERACKYYAAWLSYVFSNTYLEASTGPISVSEPFEQRAKLLSQLATKALAKARGKQTIITKKVPLLREYTADEQEADRNKIELTVS